MQARHFADGLSVFMDGQHHEFSDISLTDFKRSMFHRYQHAPHLALLDAELTRLAQFLESGNDTEIHTLVIEMPPRHGKSLTLSQMFPAWFLGRNPGMSVILASHTASLAVKHSTHTRNLTWSPRYQSLFPIAVSRARGSAAEWEIHGHGGGMKAIGIAGGITGFGANLLICDDLVLDRQQAESETQREKIYQAFMVNLFTRLDPPSAVVLNATRWHLDDPIGRLLERWDPATYRRLRLPAVAEPKDPLGREPGEALWPERFPMERLARLRSDHTPYDWAALYQQAPVPAEGGFFKRGWFSIVREESLPEMVGVARFWDLAMSSRETADWTVGTLMGLGTDAHFYVLDVDRVQMEWGDVVPHIAEVVLADGPDIPQGIEKAGFMTRAIGELNADPRFHTYQIWGYPRDKDKLTNASPFAAKAAAGMVHLLAGHWNSRWLDELTGFSGSGDVTDDQVDSAAGAYLMLSGQVGGGDGQMVRTDEDTVGSWW